jgi:hypothetical protein
VMVKRALPAWDTSRQCCSRHHCRLDIQIGSVVEAITVGLSYHPAVLAWASLSARATNRQCCLEQHCRLKPQASNVVLSITVSSSHKPIVFSRASLLAWATSWQCSLEKHCRLEPRAGSVGSTGHYRVVPGTDTLFLDITGGFELPAVIWTPHHCRFKIRQWRGILNWQWCPGLG